MHLAVQDHVAVDPGADLRRDVGIEVELAVLGEPVRVARRQAVDEGAADARPGCARVARLEAVLEHEPRLGRALGQARDDRRRRGGRRAVARHVDDGVDLGFAQRRRVEQVGDRPVLGEVDARVAQARLRAREEAVERARRRAVAHGEDPADALVVEEQLDDAPPDRLVGVRDEDVAHARLRSTSCCTARRTWLAR